MIRRPGAILALFTGLNLLNYLDRYVLAAVLPKVQGELGLSNTVAGLLGTVFLAGYSVTSPVFGALGDRMRRTFLIAFGIFVWSAATCASGLAAGALSLLAARAFVGVGEASYATLSPTIIDDTTEETKKGRALAIFYAAAPIGSALGYLVGGFVEKRYGWRGAFFVAGGPGVALALVSLLVSEPKRKVKEKPEVWRDLRLLASIPRYRQAVLGYCAYTAAIGGFSFWAPKYLVARYAMDLGRGNFVFGIVTVLAGAIGTLAGGRIADARVARAEAAKAKEYAYRESAKADDDAAARAKEEAFLTSQLFVCAVGSAFGAPLAVACFLAPTSTLFFVFAFLAMLFLFLGSSPINAALLRSVPTELRASAMALAILAIHALGDFWSPPLVGFLADIMPIQIAMLALPIAIAASALVWWPRGLAQR
jgi:MFS family permease